MTSPKLHNIKSKNNEIVKHISDLIRDKKSRQDTGEVVCEGEHMLKDALISGVKINTVIINEEVSNKILFKYNLPDDCMVYTAGSHIIKNISDVKTPQGIIFSCVYKTREKNYNVCRNIMLLDCVQDPGNVGTIIRSADAFNVDKVILGHGCADCTSPKVIRSTMGSLFRVDIENRDIREAICDIKECEFELFATELCVNSVEINHVDFKRSAVVMGNEAHGISRDIIDLCDKKIIIPMSKTAQSLNVSVAASIIMWEMSRDR